MGVDHGSREATFHMALGFHHPPFHHKIRVKRCVTLSLNAQQAMNAQSQSTSLPLMQKC